MKAVNLFLLALSLTAISTSASAARYKASNYIYFDANGAPIGQTATYCNGVQWSGGNTTSSIFLKITTGCGATEFCPPEDDQCHVGVDNTLSIILAGNPPFTRQEACTLIGSSPCQSMAPELLWNYRWTPVRTK